MASVTEERCDYCGRVSLICGVIGPCDGRAAERERDALRRSAQTKRSSGSKRLAKEMDSK